MEPLTLGQFGHLDTIEVATRYFTSRRDDPFGVAVPFNRHVDPKHILTNMSNDKYFHGEDNRVLYYALRHNPDESPIR